MESQSNAHATHGFEHPEERFEFARFCLLTQYSRNDDFTGELEGLASKYLVVLDAAGSRAFAGGIEQLADYRLAWGMLSFLAKEPRPGGIAHSLKKLIDGYRGELRALVDRWRMDANWASASLHQAFLARRSAEGSTRSSSGGWSPDRRFLWDLDRQGSLPYDTLLTLPALLVRSDAPGRRVDLRLLTEGSERVYYDPRMDSWDDSLARVRELLGKKRLSSAQSQELLERRAEIEAAFAEDGYTERRKPRRLLGYHALARWTYWTYLAICPPGKTTEEILPLIGKGDVYTQHVDHVIKHVLDLLSLPSRLRIRTL